MSDLDGKRQNADLQAIYEAALKNTPDFVYVIGLDGRFTYANEALLKMWGKTAEAIRGQSLLELGYEPWHADMHNREIAEVIATKKPIRGEVPFTGQNGKRIYDYIFAPIFDEAGTVTAISGTTRDITESKMAQIALRESIERERIITKASEFMGIWNYDLRTNLVTSDERFAKLYSVDPAWAARGAPIEEFTKTIHPDDLSHVSAEIERAISVGGDFSSEYRLVPPKGPLSWVVARGRVDTDDQGKAYRFAGAVVDITDRKLAEEKLQKREKQFRKLTDAVLSNSADFNYALDLDGRFVYVNKPLLDSWGKTYSETIGKNFADLDYPKELAAKFQQQIKQVIETKQQVKDETRFVTTQGERAYEYMFSPVLDETGNVEIVAGSTRDVTSFKDADKRKDEFLAMLAHELRNPLAPISNSIHFLRSSEILPARREEAAALVDRQVTQMTNLLNDLLDVSRVTLGKIELRPETVALNDILNMAIESVQPLVEEKGHGLKVNLPSHKVLFKGDRTRLSQIFSNLLNNSVKYTDRGGLIRLVALEDHEGIKVIISDNGLGIAKDVQPRIFDLFAQADSSLERSQSGLGIGLTLVKTLVEMHKGSVTVTSEGIGKGTSFIVALPKQDLISEPKVLDVKMNDPENKIVARRILVVDDNEASAKTLGWTFEMLGHTFEMAHDGKAAVELARTYNPDVILLDIGLPIMNGYEVCKLMRNDPVLKNKFIIAQTGWGQKEHLDRSKEAGFDRHLVKPIRIEDLEQILKDLAPTAKAS